MACADETEFWSKQRFQSLHLRYRHEAAAVADAEWITGDEQVVISMPHGIFEDVVLFVGKIAIMRPTGLSTRVSSSQKMFSMSQVWAANMQLFQGIYLVGQGGPPKSFFSEIISTIKHVGLTI
jgi:hypothetical protein